MGWRSVSRTTASFACIRSAHNGREMPITAAAKGDRQAECETAFRLGLHPSDGAEPGQGSTHALIVNYHQHTQSSLLRPGHRSLYFFFPLSFCQHSPFTVPQDGRTPAFGTANGQKGLKLGVNPSHAKLFRSC